MRLSMMSLLIATALVLAPVQGKAAEPKAAAMSIRMLGEGKCQVLDKTLECSDVTAALAKAGVAKDALIQLQIVEGLTLGEVVPLISELQAAGFTGVSKNIEVTKTNGS